MTSGSYDSDRVPKISELVRRQIDAGVSARQLSRACDEVVAHQAFTSIARGDIKGWPKNTTTVEGIARAIGVDVRAVVLGFAADLGLDVRESRSLLAAQLPASAMQLGVQQTTLLSQLIEWIAVGEFADGRVVVPHARDGGSDLVLSDGEAEVTVQLKARRREDSTRAERRDDVPYAALEGPDDNQIPDTPPGQSEEHSP